MGRLHASHAAALPSARTPATEVHTDRTTNQIVGNGKLSMYAYSVRVEVWYSIITNVQSSCSARSFLNMLYYSNCAQTYKMFLPTLVAACSYLL